MVCRSGGRLHRWTFYKKRGGSARMIGDIGRIYKLFWQGCNKGTAVVGVIITERWVLEEEVAAAIKRIKIGKSAGPIGVVSEM